MRDHTWRCGSHRKIIKNIKSRRVLCPHNTKYTHIKGVVRTQHPTYKDLHDL